jgi:hypothetical protein
MLRNGPARRTTSSNNNNNNKSILTAKLRFRFPTFRRLDS